MTFAKKPPKYEMFISEFANMSIEVPAERSALQGRGDLPLPGRRPHPQLRAAHALARQGLPLRGPIYPDGKRETLLSVPRWDFNWQNVYRFEEPIKVPKGTKLHAVAHWDNSANNPLNPDPKKSVKFGLQTWDEMMVGFVAYVWERPETAAELAKNPPSPADQFFDRLDVNGDDFITPDEMPERLRLILVASGIKLPDKVNRAEFVKIYDEMRKRFPSPRKDP